MRKLTGREWEVASMVLCHVDIEASRAGDLLHAALRARCTPEILQASHSFEHRCQCDTACIFTKASVWTHAIVNVGF